MKKRWIPCIALALVVVFLGGLWLGSEAGIERAEAARVAGQEIATTIAVVNSDVGALIGDARINYSSAIIDTLGGDIVLVSPAMAQNGLSAGAYSAVVTFPANVSERILSFNSPNPTRVELEFQVNPNLTEAAYIETHRRLLEMQRSINGTLANTYLSSILSEFHLAQDEITRIFGNDVSSLNALVYLQLQAFTASLNMASIPDIPFNPFEAETAQYLLAMVNFARNISNLYLDSYEDATRAYLAMRESLIALTEDFPEQKFHWLTLLDAWIDISWEYANSVTIYSDDTHAHREAMDAWHTALSTWLEELEGYQDELEDWESELFDWLYEATIEHQLWIGFLELVYDFVNEVEDMRYTLAAAFNNIIDEIEDWLDEFEGNWEDLKDEWGNLEDAWVELVEARIDVWDELEEARDELLTMFNRVAGLFGVYNEAVEDNNAFVELLFEFFEALGDWQENMADTEDHFSDLMSYIAVWRNFQTQVNNLPSRPSRYNFYSWGYFLCYCCWVFRPTTVFNGWGYSNAITNWLYNIDNIPTPFPTDMTGMWNILAELYETLEILANTNFTELEVCEDFEDELAAITPPDFDLPDLGVHVFERPNFDRPNLPDPIDSLPSPSGGLPSFPNIAPPPQAPNVNAPTQQNPIDDFDGVRPYRPDLTEPPIPESFWDSLADMHEQLMSFNVDDFLTDDILRQIDAMLVAYEAYLYTVRADLARQFGVNVNMLHGVRNEYLRYLANFRSDAIRAEAEEMANLRDLVAIFREIVEGNSEDTQERLEFFRSMMPDTRSDAGLNHSLVNFAVTPFELVPPVLRAEVEVNLEAFSQTWLWIALGTFAVVTLAVVSVEAVSVRKKRDGN